MLSAYLFITSGCRISALTHLGIFSENNDTCDTTEPIIWLRSSKLPFNGECLADKGFQNTDRFFAYLSRVRCPRMLRNRDVKQCDVIEISCKM